MRKKRLLGAAIVLGTVMTRGVFDGRDYSAETHWVKTDAPGKADASRFHPGEPSSLTAQTFFAPVAKSKTARTKCGDAGASPSS